MNFSQSVNYCQYPVKVNFSLHFKDIILGNAVKENGHYKPQPAIFENLIRPDLKNYCPASNLAFNEKVKNMQAEGETVYHFGFGQVRDL